MSTLIMPKRWKIHSPNPQRQVALSNALEINPIIAQLLINRRILTVPEAATFLSADLSQLHDPFLLKDMDRAVERIKRARQRQELVLIFGDYDADGVTSSVLLHRLLKNMGIEVLNHIPHRMHDGYGLNHRIGEYAKQKGVSLLITVDCGIGAICEVDTLNELGIDVIIVDHHEAPRGQLPQAKAIINPKRHDCGYPFKHLASVGLVAKLTQALLGKILEDELDLVAIGTVADVAELKGENRIFVKNGLSRIDQTKNKGLSALLEVAKIKGKKLSPYHVGFILGPRINATGRMDSAHKSLDLLLSEDPQEAHALAKLLENYNTERQKMQRDIVQEAMSIIEQQINFNEHKIIVVGKEGWHKGVLGIVASKITETFYRPTVVISVKDGVGTASARSIAGFHLYEALEHCAEILEHFGGHKGAAGLTIKEENIEKFRKLINDFAHQTLQLVDLTPSIDIDCEIPLSSLSLDLIKAVNLLEPFGEGNPAPVFCSRRLMVKSPPLTLGKETIKFWVSDGQSTFSVVGFGMAKYRDMVVQGKWVDLAYELAIDDWNIRHNGKNFSAEEEPRVQLKLKDIKENPE